MFRRYYNEESDVKEFYLTLFNRRFVWHNGEYHGYYNPRLNRVLD